MNTDAPGWLSASGSNRSPSPLPPQNVKPSVYKSRLCVFHAAGRCSHGTACSFAHSAYELNDPKTVICPKMDQFGFCDDQLFQGVSACPFAHDPVQLKQLPKVVKTALCRYYPQGRCKAGTACRHAHAIEDIDPAYLSALYTPEASSLTALYLAMSPSSAISSPAPTPGLMTPSPLCSPKATSSMAGADIVGEAQLLNSGEGEMDLQSLQASLLALAFELERLRNKQQN